MVKFTPLQKEKKWRIFGMSSQKMRIGEMSFDISPIFVDWGDNVQDREDILYGEPLYQPPLIEGELL